jgi:uncharacterized tellurite resistance protein B-like protein
MKSRTLDLWDKYSKCDKQTIVIVAVLVLSAKLCKADGQFSQVEEDEILKIIPHESYQRTMLLEILEEGANDPNPIQEDARRLKKILGENNTTFFEFIIAVLYRLAEVDHIIREEEIRDINLVAIEFGVIKESITQHILNLVFKNKKKSKLRAYG